MCSRGGDGTTTGGERTFWTFSGMSVAESGIAMHPWQRLASNMCFEFIGHALCTSVPRACRC